jgi:hypothetical protein
VAKPTKSDRRAVADQIRNQQKGAERRRGLLILGICVGVAVLIVGAAAWQPLKSSLDQRKYDDMAVSEIGAPADVCRKITTKPAKGAQQHVEPGTPLEYDDAPPAFGRHYNVWDGMERKLYTEGDRPDLGELVHNLEHGYTIIWYDETAAADEQVMETLRGLAGKFEGTEDLRDKVKVVPWTKEDGGSFPEGQHIAYTHWSVGGAGGGQPTADSQVGVFQYCSEPSGAALEDFMLEYPYMDSPEPNAV